MFIVHRIYHQLQYIGFYVHSQHSTCQTLCNSLFTLSTLYMSPIMWVFMYTWSKIWSLLTRSFFCISTLFSTHLLPDVTNVLWFTIAIYHTKQSCVTFQCAVMCHGKVAVSLLCVNNFLLLTALTDPSYIIAHDLQYKVMFHCSS